MPVERKRYARCSRGFQRRRTGDLRPKRLGINCRYKMTFGKYKGRHILDFPKDYLDWARSKRVVLPTDREIEQLRTAKAIDATKVEKRRSMGRKG